MWSWAGYFFSRALVSPLDDVRDCVEIGMFLDGIWWKDPGMFKSYPRQQPTGTEIQARNDNPRKQILISLLVGLLPQSPRNALVSRAGAPSPREFFILTWKPEAVFLPHSGCQRKDWRRECKLWFCFKKTGSGQGTSLSLARNPMHNGPIFPFPMKMASLGSSTLTHRLPFQRKNVEGVEDFWRVFLPQQTPSSTLNYCFIMPSHL